MKRKIALMLGCVAVFFLSGLSYGEPPKSPLLMPDGKVLGQSGQYVIANGVKTYYEIHGEGEPLLLIHGDFSFVELWKDTLPVLMKRFKVIVPERRGHGRSYDGPEPYTYDLFADDMAGLLKALGIKRVHVVGHSGGANTALLMGYKYPERVNRLVCISTWFNAAGSTYEYLRDTVRMTPDNFSPPMMNYWKKLNPMGADHFPKFFEKMKRLWLESPVLLPEELKKITAPTMIMTSDRDWVRLDHSVTLFESLPKNPDPKADLENRQMAVIPSSGHMFPYEKPDLVNRLILDFLVGNQRKEKAGTSLGLPTQ